MRREATLRGGENKRRSISNASNWKCELRDKTKIPSGRNSAKGKQNWDRPRINAGKPTQKISIELSIINRNSGSIPNGLVSCTSKHLYISAPAITRMKAITAKPRMRFQDTASSIQGLYCAAGCLLFSICAISSEKPSVVSGPCLRWNAVFRRSVTICKHGFLVQSIPHYSGLPRAVHSRGSTCLRPPANFRLLHLEHQSPGQAPCAQFWRQLHLLLCSSDTYKAR